MCTSRKFELGGTYEIDGKDYIYAQVNSNGDTNFIDPTGGAPALSAPLTTGNGISRRIEPKPQPLPPTVDETVVYDGPRDEVLAKASKGAKKRKT